MKIPKVISDKALLAVVKKVAQKGEEKEAEPTVNRSFQSSFTQVDDDLAVDEKPPLSMVTQSMMLDISQLSDVDKYQTHSSFSLYCNTMPDLQVEKVDQVNIIGKKKPRIVEKEIVYVKEKNNKKYLSGVETLALGIIGVLAISQRILLKGFFSAIEKKL